MAPAAIGTDRTATVRRTPKRSKAMPTGICPRNTAMKKAPLAKPSASEDSARSRISSGPMTDVEERKNWERAVVDASIASTARVAVHVGAGGT